MSVRVLVDREVRATFGGDARRALVRVARRAATRLGFSHAEIEGLGLRIVGDATMIELCRQHLGDAHVTDVLSFPALEDPFSASAGDIAIDWQQVVRQAPGGPLAWAAEGAQLLVHGLAHLAGHDHDRADAARAMLRAEELAARAAALPVPRRPYGGVQWSR